MAASLQLKGGTAAKVAAYTPLAREVVIDTDNYRLVIGDGSTAGGKPLTVVSAPKWTTARKLEFTGAATGESDSVDGSADISIALTLGAVDLGTLA
ncbi:hypothetical protein [Pantoea cypripedii]|uniref:Major tropism determinant N-terminal domain-containing protein n=1 Tax=Pantoea cypripedii TaxID=55209 RepID=A0A6B9G9X2_PANCY|nr:hypothetical protein [Pantoea cypripedii]QGY29759.1 hypothetical protein CUN67_12795 [Pantoea cypripedii]